jgi:hypothetical protein
MIRNSVSPAGEARLIADPPGWTDLNTLLAGMLADCVATHVRCETLPLAAGGQEEWWLLLRWLLKPLLQNRAADDVRYAHVQCCEDLESREQHFLLTVRCSGLAGLTRAFTFSNPQLSGIAARLGVAIRQPAAADAHCLFILQFAGKKTIHAH